MMNESVSPRPAGDEPTPGILHQSVIHDRELFWGVFWAWFGERLTGWARANLGHVGIGDPSTADDVVQRIVVKLLNNWSYDPDKGRLGTYLKGAVFREVQQELRERQRRPGNYGQAAADDGVLKNLEKSLEDSLRDLDSDWQRQRRERTRLAVEQTRGEFFPHEWEVFYLLTVAGRTGPETAREVNERFRPEPLLKPAQVYPINYRVRRSLEAALTRAGVDIQSADPQMFLPALLDALAAPRGAAEPSDPGSSRGSQS